MAWVPAALAAASWADEQYRKGKESGQPTSASTQRPISNMMDIPSMEERRAPEEQYWRPQPQPQEQIQMLQPLPVRQPPAQQMPAEVPNTPLPVTPPPAMPQEQPAGYWRPQRQRMPWE